LTVEIPAAFKVALANEIARLGSNESAIVTAALSKYLGIPAHTDHRRGPVLIGVPVDYRDNHKIFERANEDRFH
jgi:hypothetical protein